MGMILNVYFIDTFAFLYESNASLLRALMHLDEILADFRRFTPLTLRLSPTMSYT